MGESIQTCTQGVRNLQTRTGFRDTTTPETEELPVEKHKYNTRKKKKKKKNFTQYQLVLKKEKNEAWLPLG